MRMARRRVSRRDFLKAGGVGLAGAAMLGGGALAGCGGGGSEGGPITLTFGPDDSGGLQALVDRFNRENEGGVQVEWRQTAAASDEYFEQMLAELQAGRGNVDVIAGDVIWTAQFAANGYILDVSDRFPESEREKYLPAPIDSLLYEGAIYGVPWFTDAGMFYYRQDLLEKSGYSEPPKTWDEMKEMAEKVRADSGTRFGFVFQGARDEGGVVDALEHVWNAGGDVLDGEEVIVDSPEAIEGLTVRRSMISDGIAPESSADYSTQESQAIFTNGDAVFMRNWPFVYGLLSDPELSQVKPEQVGISAIPVATGGVQSFSGLGGWNFLVNAASEDRLDEIWTFIEFMTAPEQQRSLAFQSARLPTLNNLYEDKEVIEKVPVADLGREALANARPRPVSPYYSDMSLEMAEQFNASLKDVSVERALNGLKQSLQEIADQA